MVLGKVVRLIKDFGFIYVMQGEQIGKRIYFTQSDDKPLRLHNIVRFNVGKNDKEQLQAEDIEVFTFKSLSKETEVLPDLNNLLGIVQSYDPKAGWGFIELQLEDGKVEKQYVHHTAIVTKSNCYKKLEKYEAVYVDVSNVTEGHHSGKSQCSKVRSVSSKLRCETRRSKPKSKSSEYTSETHTPETHTPETHTPETHTPETRTPETRTPETHTPETHTPETHTPKDDTLL